MNIELLKEKAEMLEEYFCIYVDSLGNFSRLPVILDQYTPNMDWVPKFVLCLDNDVSSKLYFPPLKYDLVFLFILAYINNNMLPLD